MLAAVQQIKVTVGKPTIEIIPQANSTVYWGFDSRIDINVTNAAGNGLTGGTIKLRKLGNTSYIRTTPQGFIHWWDVDNGVDVNISSGVGGLFINETGNGNYSIEINRYGPVESGGIWDTFVTGSWKLYYTQDVNSDGTDEYNNTVSFSIRSQEPPVRLIVTNDGDGEKTDMKVNVPSTASSAGPAGYIDIEFKILGRTLSGNRAYYGDDTHEITDVETNLQITGDILYKPIYGATLGVGGCTLDYLTKGQWVARVIPTEPGGNIRLKIVWPGSNNGTSYQDISIVNGTYVTTNIDTFYYGDETWLTITLKDMDGSPIKTGTVWVFWKGGTNINATTGNNKAGKGKDGQYTLR